MFDFIGTWPLTTCLEAAAVVFLVCAILGMIWGKVVKIRETHDEPHRRYSLDDEGARQAIQQVKREGRWR